jgi:hypothetical protein
MVWEGSVDEVKVAGNEGRLGWRWPCGGEDGGTKCLDMMGLC